MDLISSYKIQEIFLNNLFSFDDPLTMVTLLLEVKRRTNAELVIPIHDFFSICPSWPLLNEKDCFCGIPNIERCHQCLPVNHGNFSFLVDCKDIDMWRWIWGACLHKANRILCFSQSSRDLICRAYPDLDKNKFEIRPHTVDYLPKQKIKLSYAHMLNIGIAGKIDEHKGSEMVRQMVQIIEERRLPIIITVIGEMDRAPSSTVIKITGRYSREELPQIIEKNGVSLFFLPSIWPETFSYVTEEIMQFGLPLAVFNLGAPAERVANYEKGLIISKIDAETALKELLAFRDRLYK